MHVNIFKIYFNISIADIKDDYASPEDIPDFHFPIAQADITRCSLYAVVCRLKSSPPYTITSTGGLFSHPDFPGVAITIPENAVAPSAEFPLTLKVGVITYQRGTVPTHISGFFYGEYLALLSRNTNKKSPKVMKAKQY